MSIYIPLPLAIVFAIIMGILFWYGWRSRNFEDVDEQQSRMVLEDSWVEKSDRKKGAEDENDKQSLS